MRNRGDGKPIAKDVYESIAERYEAHAKSSAHNAYCERPAMLSLIPDVKGQYVLDAACGAGFYTEWLVNHGAHVIAFDVSRKMVQLTRQRLGNSIDVCQADLAKPFDFLKDKSLDLVVCALALDYVEDLKGVFYEFYRVLRLSGLLIFSLSHPATGYVRDKVDYFATELIERKSPTYGIVFPAYRRPLRAIFDPLWELDFVVEKFIEARPIAACRNEHPEIYESLSKRPSFLCIRARKQPMQDRPNTPANTTRLTSNCLGGLGS